MSRIIGKIADYNGVSGIIIDKEKVKYVFTSKDLLDKEINTGDIVSFEPELYKTVEIKINLARFISKENN